jgi:predicted nucleic acid-binding protein
MVEVYYDRIREVGSDAADAIIQDIYDNWPVTVIELLNRPIVREASCLKAEGKMSFADTVLVSTALHTGATIVTSDWTELEPTAVLGVIPFM